MGKIGIGIGIEIEMGMEMEMHFPIVCGCLVLWHSNTPNAKGQRASNATFAIFRLPKAN